MRSGREIPRWALVIACVTVLTLSAGRASATMTEEQVKAKVAEAYGVEVLRVRRAALDGRDVFLVTMMHPGGDFDGAFQVNTIAVDIDTGDLVSRFRHRPSGADANEAPSYRSDRQPVDALQSGFVWR